MTAKNPNIAFTVPTGREELYAESDKVIEELKNRTGAKTNTDAYEQMMKITLGSFDTQDIRNSGGDIDGLEASLENIRSMYAAVVKSKAEIAAAKDSAVSEARQKAEARAEKAESEKEQLRAIAEKASSEAANAVLQAEQAQSSADAARKQAESAQALIEAKDDKIASLREQLEAANEKLKGYDALKEERDDLARQLTEARNDAEKASLTAQLKAQQAQEELKSRIASLEAEVKVLREMRP